MKEEELKRLIEKYYNGGSTDEEEKTLKNYFSQELIPDGYAAEKAIFSYFAESEDILEPSEGFEARLLAGIDASEGKKGLQGIRRYLVPFLSAAAGLLVLAGSYFIFLNKSETADTFRDPDIAYAETIRILRDVSVRMNRGAHELEPVARMNEVSEKSFRTVKESAGIVRKNLMNLDWLQKAIDMTGVYSEKNVNK